MSSKEKVLAIRPEAVCVKELVNMFFNHHRTISICSWEISINNITIGDSYFSEEGAWAAAYKYLTK